jgi:hypothetical protein
MKQLKLGQKVLVTPSWTNKDLPKPKSNIMYVTEKTKGTCTGLSHRKGEEKHIYWILTKLITIVN